MQAVILAAGLGSRLYPFSDVIPKIMLPIGDDQKPVGQHIINHCLDFDIEEFVFCLNRRKGKQVINYFGNGSRFGVDIKYSLSDHPLGTAGELKMAWSQGLIKLPSLIYYGDTLASTDIYDLTMNHFLQKGDISITVNDNIKIPVGYVEDLSGLVTLIKEKPALSELNVKRVVDSGGILPIFYVTNEDFYKLFCAVGKDVVNNVFREMLGAEYNIIAYHDTEPFLDIGNWKSYVKANKEWNF